MSGEIRLEGFPVSEGIAIGVPFFLESAQDAIPAFPISMKEVDSEIDRYRKALFSSREDLKQIQTSLAEEGSDDAITILDTHIQMLEDPMMTTHMEEKIRQMLQNTESVFHSVITDYETRFSKTTNVFFQERMIDVVDLAKRVLNHLCPQKGWSLEDAPFNSIVFSNELIPSHIAAAQSSKISAFVTLSGGGNSHAALIARAKGIPYVSCVDIKILQNISAKCAIVDGQTGEVVLNPTIATLSKYKHRKTSLKTSYQIMQREGKFDAETQDGSLVKVFANIGSLSDLENFKDFGAAGIGLLRTEYLIFQNDNFLFSEEEQCRSYKGLIEIVGQLPIVIRAFDIGGDKTPEGLLEGEREPNPVLGCRGIRFLLRHKNIFKTQLKAILRAGVTGNIRVMLPLIADLSELEESKRLMQECAQELEQEGIAYKLVPLGCMIEVPSAVLLCDAIAQKCDFLSIGTNDLVQYTLGIDRSNPSMSDFCYPAHPSVIRMIKMIVTEAKRNHKRISLCGEIASNPMFIPLLLGLGVEEFSCSPRYIPVVKRAIRQTNLLNAYDLAHQVLSLTSSLDVSQALLKATL